MKTTDQDFQMMMTRYFESNDALMKAHFEDDKKAFDGIRESFAQIIERLEKREALAVQNGEHFSAMGKELAIMNDTLLELKPVLDDYKADKVTRETLARYATPIVAVAKGIAAVIGGFVATWAAFKAASAYLIR